MLGVYHPKNYSELMPSCERVQSVSHVSVQVHGTHVRVEGDPTLEFPEWWIPDDLTADYKVRMQEDGRPGYWNISGGPASAQRVGELVLRLPKAEEGQRDLVHGLHVKTESMPGSGRRDVSIDGLHALSVVAVANGGNIRIENTHADSLLYVNALIGRVNSTYCGGSALIRRCTAGGGYGVMAQVDDILMLDRVGSDTSSTGHLRYESVVASRCVVRRLPTGKIEKDLPTGFYVLPGGLDDPLAKEILLGEGKPPIYE